MVVLCKLKIKAEVLEIELFNLASFKLSGLKGIINRSHTNMDRRNLFF